MSEHRKLIRLPESIFGGLQSKSNEPADTQPVLEGYELRREIVAKLKNSKRVRNTTLQPQPHLQSLNKQSQLQYESISTVGAFLRHTLIFLVKALDPLLTYSECQELRRRICVHCAPKMVAASQLLAQSNCTVQFLPTGVNYLDQHLKGGIQVGTITEVIGSAGTGKTQLALQTAVQALEHGLGSIFIDTEKKVSVKRLAEIASHHNQASLQQISIHAPTDWDNLQHVLGTLEDHILNRGSPIRLLVIDSIAAPARREFESAVTQASAVLHTAQVVKDLAHQFQLAVLIVNQVGQTGAALGTAWHHCVSSRIQLQRDTQDHSKRFSIVLKSNIVAPSDLLQFQITKQGLMNAS